MSPFQHCMIASSKAIPCQQYSLASSPVRAGWLRLTGCAAQIRNVALGSTADLMKNQEAHAAVAADKDFLRSVVAALQVRHGAGPADATSTWSLASRDVLYLCSTAHGRVTAQELGTPCMSRLGLTLLGLSVTDQVQVPASRRWVRAQGKATPGPRV